MVRTKRGDLLEVLPGKDWRTVLETVRLPEPCGEDLAAMHVTTRAGGLSLPAIWMALPIHERYRCLSFSDECSKGAALASHRAWVSVVEKEDLFKIISDDPDNFTLLHCVEFATDPRDPNGPITGLMFGPALALGNELWAALRRSHPGWGGQGEVPLPPTQWPSLFEPLPSSCAELQTMMASLLEQRFLQLASDARRSIAPGTASQSTPAPILPVSRSEKRAMQKSRKKAMKKQAKQDTSAQPAEMLHASSASCGSPTSPHKEEAACEQGKHCADSKMGAQSWTPEAEESENFNTLGTSPENNSMHEPCEVESSTNPSQLPALAELPGVELRCTVHEEQPCKLSGGFELPGDIPAPDADRADRVFLADVLEGQVARSRASDFASSNGEAHAACWRTNAQRCPRGRSWSVRPLPHPGCGRRSLSHHGGCLTSKGASMEVVSSGTCCGQLNLEHLPAPNGCASPRGAGARDTSPTTSPHTPSTPTVNSDASWGTESVIPAERVMLAQLPCTWLMQPTVEELDGLSRECHLIHATVQNTFLTFATFYPGLEQTEEPSRMRRRAKSSDSASRF